jgi:hypothetical protein
MYSKLLFPVIAGLSLMAADRYNGPRPPKPDIPYLLHANHLVETEVSEAREQSGKKETMYVIPGAASPAKTPMAEPIFIIESSHITPEQIELYRLDVKNGAREVLLTQKRRGHTDAGPFHMLVTRLAEHLYKIEADEPLQNGQYSLSPNGSNRVFCFEIY